MARPGRGMSVRRHPPPRPGRRPEHTWPVRVNCTGTPRPPASTVRVRAALNRQARFPVITPPVIFPESNGLARPDRARRRPAAAETRRAQWAIGAGDDARPRARLAETDGRLQNRLGSCKLLARGHGRWRQAAITRPGAPGRRV